MTFDISDDVRKAINWRKGKLGLADREDTITHIEAVLIGDFETICRDMDHELDFEPQKEPSDGR